MHTDSVFKKVHLLRFKTNILCSLSAKVGFDMQVAYLTRTLFGTHHRGHAYAALHKTFIYFIYLILRESQYFQEKASFIHPHPCPTCLTPYGRFLAHHQPLRLRTPHQSLCIQEQKHKIRILACVHIYGA